MSDNRGESVKIKEKSMSLSLLAQEKIIQYIEAKHLKEGDRLPSEFEFKNMLGVSRSVVREALAMLEQKGMILKVQGRGTFIQKRPDKMESGLEKLESVSETIKSFGFEPSTKWVYIGYEVPDADVREQLGIKKGEAVATFRRLRLADGMLAAYSETYVSKEFIDISLPNSLEYESLFDYFEEEHNIFAERAVTEIVPVWSNEPLQEIMELDHSRLFVLMRQLYLDKEQRHVIFSKDYYSTDYFTFKVNRSR